MRPKELSTFLDFMITNRFPVLIKGAPGIGKTSLVEQSAKRLGIDLIVSHPVVSDPTDYKGLPYAEGGEAHFLPFGDLKRLIDAEVPTVYFLDDMGQATPAVQSALMQLILARRVNGHKISDYVTFVSATNRREDRANVQGILDPVKSRFVSIVELNIHADDWIAWALDASMPNDLIAFVSWKPDVLSSPGTREIENTSNPRCYGICSCGDYDRRWKWTLISVPQTDELKQLFSTLLLKQ